MEAGGRHRRVAGAGCRAAAGDAHRSCCSPRRVIPTVRRVTRARAWRCGDRIARVAAVDMAFLDGQARLVGARIAYLQGDASTRGYARLSRRRRHGAADGCAAPAGRSARSRWTSPTARSRIWPRTWCGRSPPSPRRCARPDLSAPEVLAEDLDAGLLLVEDLGDRVFSAEVARDGAPQDELWRAAVDALVELRARAGAPVHCPCATAAHIPAATTTGARCRSRSSCCSTGIGRRSQGESVPRAMRAEFLPLWSAVIERTASAASGLGAARFPFAQSALAAGAGGHRGGSASSISRTPSAALPPTTWSRCCRTRAWMCRRPWRETLLAHYLRRPCDARASTSTQLHSCSPTPRLAPSATPRSSAFSCGLCAP